MILKIKITFKEYVKLLYALTYKKPIMIFLICADVLMIVWVLGYDYAFLPVPEPTYSQYLTITLISVVQPIVIFSTIWRNYHSSSHLKEPMEIELTQAEIKMTGESFYTILKWEKMFKVEELGSWFLIYQNNLAAILIPKKILGNNGEEEFKKLVLSIPGIPVNLKRTDKK